VQHKKLGMAIFSSLQYDLGVGLLIFVAIAHAALTVFSVYFGH
jgi:hypothetical protein